MYAPQPASTVLQRRAHARALCLTAFGGVGIGPGGPGRICLQAFIKDKKYPQSTPVTRLTEGAETAIFIQQFDVWPHPQLSPNYTPKRTTTVAASVDQKPLDYKALYGLKRAAAPAFDNGQGKLKVPGGPSALEVGAVHGRRPI